MYTAMANLGISRQTMANIFIIMIVCGSLAFGIYVILSNRLLCKTEGFKKLEPIYNSPMCGYGSAHEVPIWEGSLTPETPVTTTDKTPSVQEQPDVAESKTENKPNKYSFLANEIEVESKPVEKPQIERKFLSDLNVSNTVNRPKVTSTEYVKQPKGAHSGLGFNTGAMN